MPTTGGASTHLQLTASVETVIGLDGASGGDLEFAGPVPAATVQRLACDARVRRVLLGPSSAVLAITAAGEARDLAGISSRRLVRAACFRVACFRVAWFSRGLLFARLRGAQLH